MKQRWLWLRSYPLHKLGALVKGGIKIFAWGFVISFTENSGLMVAWVSRDVDQEKFNEVMGRNDE